MAAVEFGTAPVSTRITAVQRLMKLARRALPNPSSASHAPRNRDILFVVAGRTQADIAVGRKNWLVDDFALTFADESVVVQYRELGEQKRVFQDTFSFHDAELRGDLGARLRPLSERKRDQTLQVISSIFDALNFPVESPHIAVATAKVLRHQARVERMRLEYDALLDRIRPRIVIMDGAAYGGSRAIQVRAARERGIPVAELQHGWIGSSHGAYNFGSAMQRPELQQYLPNTLLTFGEFWSRGITSPFETYAIGKPHLEHLAEIAPGFEGREKAVLVVSSVTDRREMAKVVLAIRDELPAGWIVRFRPHPSERSTAGQLYSELSHVDGVEIDLALDVYDSLSQARAVFGYSSTVLYEALKFGCHTFVLDSPLAEFYADREALGVPISDGTGLRRAVATVTGDSQPESTVRSRADIWASEPVARYQRFIERQLGN